MLIQKNPGTKEAEEGKLLLKKVRSIMKAQEKKKQVKIQVVNEKRLDYSNVKRIQVTVRVPALSKEKLKEEIKNLCVSYYRRGNHAVAVHVYLMTDKIKGHNWYAMYHFAPGGEWGKAAAGVPFSDYRLKVEFNTEDMRKL
ncbi:MAG: hypothetical protein GTN82_04305 [Candidatus Aminicenantes bacterium]|nr:hypothetical protein [Candidatus Aminicenantes bacterium]NIQ65777.1 hypothetical protein [Candidatus Aminicenantes bacterium]NIR04625.1 hypothetical protein [Candidatus Aminicenantes bacterium]